MSTMEAFGRRRSPAAHRPGQSGISAVGLQAQHRISGAQRGHAQAPRDNQRTEAREQRANERDQLADQREIDAEVMIRSDVYPT